MDVTAVIKYMGMTGRPFVCALCIEIQYLKKIIEIKSRIKLIIDLIIDSKRQGTNYREKIDNVSL